MASENVENGYCFTQNSTSIPKYKRRIISAVRDFPLGCGPNAPRIYVRNSVESKSEIDDTLTHELPKSKDLEIVKGSDEAWNGLSILNPTLPSSLNFNISSSNLDRKYPPRRKISAIRDFPPLCGKDASIGTGAECIKPPSCTERVLLQRDFSSHSEKSLSEKKTVVSTLKVDEFDGGAEIRNEMVVYDPERHDAAVLDEDGTGKEIVVHSEACESRGTNLFLSEKSGKRSIVYALKAASSCERSVSPLDHDFSGTEISSEHRFSNVTVQALMAAPNCPWRQSKGTNVTSRSGFQKNKGLKHGSSSGTEKSNFKLLDKRRAMIAGSNKKKASSGYVEATPLRSCHPYAAAIKGAELDSWKQDEDCNNFYACPSTREIDLPPLVPNKTKMQKDSNDYVCYNKVRETLRLFQVVYRKLTHEEEAALRRGGTPRKRIDLDTAAILREKGKYVNTEQVVGSVPGVDIGLEFQFRVELAIVGLHRPLQAGIDYMKQGGIIIATSIVASGGYADDMDSADVLNYSGSGGNPSKGDKKAEDQKLERGNLALKNSIAAKNPVRVIRGHEHKISGPSERARTVKTYTYDGLYIVTKYWQEQGINGNLVFMFRLERIPGQPELVWNLLKKSKKSKVRHGVCMSDISEGKELMPICAVNTVDDQKPPPFKYITNMLYTDLFQRLPLRGCDCVGGCSDSESCLCAVRNGGEIPYNNNGSIVEAKPLVYECGPSCKCPTSCSNRVSQSGIKFQLEIFKTESRGWGVRSLNYIPSGSFICEYLGELLEDKQAEQRIGSDEYLFDIGSNFSDQSPLDKLPDSKPHPQIGASEVVDVGYTIDAERYGNIGRFINHSCSPNLYAQNVLYDHEDWRVPHIMLFAAENIPPLQELTYHYNYNIGEVRDANGNVKTKRCFCGSADCTGRLY